MRITNELRKYKYDCKPGEYDSDVYIDMSILSKAGLSIEAMPVAIGILDKLADINFGEEDVTLIVSEITPDHIPIVLAEMKEKGLIEGD